MMHAMAFAWGARTYVMGILNITPDSFSGDGLAGKCPAEVLEQARRLVAAGADILDVGGESTRPGAQPVSASEEMERVLPVISALAAERPYPFPLTPTRPKLPKPLCKPGRG